MPVQRCRMAQHVRVHLNVQSRRPASFPHDVL